jgi:hypothetical protein
MSLALCNFLADFWLWVRTCFFKQHIALLLCGYSYTGLISDSYYSSLTLELLILGAIDEVIHFVTSGSIGGLPPIVIMIIPFILGLVVG